MNGIVDKSYFKDLEAIKETIRKNQTSTIYVVNSAMIITYYQIGTIINQRKEWGNKYIRKLSIDLAEYGKGYSYDQLKRMSRFANWFTITEIRAQPVPQIPWSSIIEIMNKSSSKEEMLWYINQTHKNKWSRTMVLKQFELKAYQRHDVEPISSSIQSNNDTQLKEIVKDTLALDFINRTDLADEKTFKSKLMDNIISFLQELGPGFALVGKEYKLVTPTNKNFYIDLLMYHTKIHAYVVIEVKINEFQPADIGQLNFYVNAVDDLERTELDNATVGILLCKDADTYVAKTTLSKLATKIGISKYKILEEIPEYLANKLNDIDEI